MTPRTILYTGKGGVGKTSVAACHRARLRGVRAAHARHLDRPRAQPVGIARRGARARAAPRRRPAVGSGGQRPGGDGAPLVRRAGVARRAVRRARRRPDLRPGADRAAGDGRAVLAAPPPGRPRVAGLGRDHRRLRADRRDPPAAVVPGRRALVDREGVPARAPDPRRRAPARALAARHPAAEPGGVRRHPAPVGEPDRDERDPPRPRALHGPPRDESRTRW